MATTGTISASGLVSGIDTTTLISKLVAVQQAPITSLQTQETALKTTQSGIATLETNLGALDTLATQLSDPNQAASYVATASDATVTAATTGAAAAGQYNVVVAQTASAQRTYSDEVSSETQSGLFGTGTISLQVGTGSPVSISVGTGDDLDSVAQKINQSGTGVGASVMYDGTGYRLQISGPGTGTANAVSFTESGTTLGLGTPSNTVSQAQNAIFSIDGFTVTSASNHVTTALPGVALDLNTVTSGASFDSSTNKVSGGTATAVTVSADPSGLNSKITSFVNAYNAVINQIATINGAGNTIDSVVNAVQTALQRVIGQPLSGLTPSVQALSEIGISTNRDGTLAINNTTLTSAIASNAGAVTNLFVKSSASTGLGSLVDKAITQMTDPYTGSLVLESQSISKQTASMDATITTMQAQVTEYQNLLTTQFNTMESNLSSIGSQQSTVANFAALFTKNSSS